jgi:hypothetical protein
VGLDRAEDAGDGARGLYGVGHRDLGGAVRAEDLAPAGVQVHGGHEQAAVPAHAVAVDHPAEAAQRAPAQGRARQRGAAGSGARAGG